jgi:hypothetical protein
VSTFDDVAVLMKREVKMSFIGMKLSLHSYLDNLCLACNLENNNR